MLYVVQCYDYINCSVIWWHLLRAQNAAGNLVMMILVAIIGNHVSKVNEFFFFAVGCVVAMLLLLWGGSQFIYKQDVNENQPEYLVEALVEDRVHSVKRVQDTVADNQAKPSHVALCLLFSGKKNLLLNAFYCHN